ncbi:chromate efflux transporter [Pseudoduganella sp. GCM10020061]|uniref:chromate efflux transporter n=1 Tax=Pseudoduganella sp. GCM10020061 TaxID=3317345 RepID=UPI003629E60D
MSAPTPGTVAEVFTAFLKLGLTSFGGPASHLAHFRTEFVERRAWVDDKQFSDLVALCQFLPGPATSQIGFVLGLGRARLGGAFAAWTAFTLPSALLLVLFALGIGAGATVAASGAVHGLKLAAVAIVAYAVLGMARTLCPDLPRAAIAVAATLIVAAMPSTAGQFAAILSGCVLAIAFLKLHHLPAGAPLEYGIGKRTGAILLLVFAALLAVLPALGAATGNGMLKLVGEFYQSGAIIFGGGHVMLPALHASVVAPGWVSEEAFLAGYGATQAVPGPMFAFSAYLGAVMQGWIGGVAGLLAIFAPGILLVAGVLPFWQSVQQRDAIRKAMAGASAAVVGILAAALYDPLWTGAIRSGTDIAIAMAGFALLLTGRVPPLAVVIACALAGWGMSAVT